MIITIGRQLGSGGLQIGQLVAKELGYDFYDKQLITEAARDSGMREDFFTNVDEKANKKLSALGFLGLRGSFSGDSFININSLSANNLFLLQSQTMERLALSSENGAVFIGRCAHYVLRNHKNLFRVFITADTDFRVSQVMNRNNCTEQEAKNLMEKVDRQRAEYNDFYANGGWGVASNYDISINSAKFGIEGTAKLLVDIIRNNLG